MQAKNIVIVTISAVAVIGGGYLISQNRAIAPTVTDRTNSPTASPTTAEESPTLSTTTRPTTRTTSSPRVSVSPTAQPSPSATPIATIVSYTNTGYHPTSIKIKSGTTIVFKNESTSSMWTASDDHPSHKNYPGSDGAKCGTPDAVSIFDACEPVQPGESWSFTFSSKGAWGYHDHLNPINKGLITVE